MGGIMANYGKNQWGDPILPIDNPPPKFSSLISSYIYCPYVPVLQSKPIIAMTPQQISISKFISKLLRHSASDYALKMAEGGWVEVEDLLTIVNDKFKGKKQEQIDLTFKTLEEIVEADSIDKKRYSFNKDKTMIRANWGHTIPIELDLEPDLPPDILYHGTKTSFLDSIMKEGLKPVKHNHVHMAQYVENAQQAADNLSGESVILQIDSLEMWKNGHQFYSSDNELIWLTKIVPTEYIKIL